MKTKGISLPIEMVIVISISVIVLLAVIAYFTSSFFRTAATINDEEAWNNGCAIIKARGCRLDEDLGALTISDYDPDGDKADNSVREACWNRLKYTDDRDCIVACCTATSRPASTIR